MSYIQPSVDCDMRLSHSISVAFFRVSDGKRVKVDLEYHRTFNSQILFKFNHVLKCEFNVIPIKLFGVVYHKLTWIGVTENLD